MKKIALLFFVFGLSFSSSQVFSQGKNSQEYLQQLNIYKKAKYFNDPITARTAIYNLIEIDPTDASWMDSLAFEYYAYRQYTSSLLVALEALKGSANNLNMLELKAICWEQIGDVNKAVDSYESLFLKNNSSITLYKIGFLQLQLKRFNEAVTSSDILLGKTDVTEITMTFSKQDETSQQVSLKAATYNLKGLIAKEQGNNEEARKQFNEALKLVPDFEIVQKNIKELGG